MRHVFYTVLAVVCLSVCACSDKNTNRAKKLKFEPRLVEMPDNKDELYQELGFTYSTIEEAEAKIVAKLDSLYATDGGYSIYRMPNDELRILAAHEPSTLTYDFPLMQERGYVNIETSEDGNLRLYYWDTYEGGTMIDWGNLCQYRSNGEVYVYDCGITELDAEEEDEFIIGCAILGLHTVRADNGEVYYLAHIYIREMSNLGFAEITPVKIENGRLVYVRLFDEEPDEWGWNPTTREYSFADWYFRTDGEGWDWIYRYDASTRTFYIPNQRDMEFSDRYSLYTFNGEKFVYAREDGGCWLHPSIRNFEFLECMFSTKDYRVRVDMMPDETYRYASWRRGVSMDNIPDLVIYNGTYDEEDGVFEFENNGYLYRVIYNETESELSVYCNGRRVMLQKQIAE